MRKFILILVLVGFMSAKKPTNVDLGMNVVTQCVVPGMVALTYDDGVSEYTSELLKVLKSERVRATFFVLGSQLAEDKGRARSMLKKMWDAGHDIGSHTYSHLYLTSASEWQIRDEMEKTDDLIAEVLRVRPVLMRPPFGNVNPETIKLLHSMGYTVVNWNIDSDDWRMEYSPASEVASHVMDMIPPRSSSSSRSYIVLQHDTLLSSVKAQRDIIRDLRSKGYKFGSLSECLGGAKVYRKRK